MSKLYCLRDRIAGNYDMIFEAASDEDAKRRLQASAAQGVSLLSTRPDDFDLVFICNLEKEVGVVTFARSSAFESSDPAEGAFYMERIAPLSDFVKPGYKYMKVEENADGV